MASSTSAHISAPSTKEAKVPETPRLNWEMLREYLAQLPKGQQLVYGMVLEAVSKDHSRKPLDAHLFGSLLRHAWRYHLMGEVSSPGDLDLIVQGTWNNNGYGSIVLQPQEGQTLSHDDPEYDPEKKMYHTSQKARTFLDWIIHDLAESGLKQVYWGPSSRMPEEPPALEPNTFRLRNTGVDYQGQDTQLNPTQHQREMQEEGFMEGLDWKKKEKMVNQWAMEQSILYRLEVCLADGEQVKCDFLIAGDAYHRYCYKKDKDEEGEEGEEDEEVPVEGVMRVLANQVEADTNLLILPVTPEAIVTLAPRLETKWIRLPSRLNWMETALVPHPEHDVLLNQMPSLLVEKKITFRIISTHLRRVGADDQQIDHHPTYPAPSRVAKLLDEGHWFSWETPLENQYDTHLLKWLFSPRVYDCGYVPLTPEETVVVIRATFPYLKESTRVQRSLVQQRQTLHWVKVKEWEQAMEWYMRQQAEVATIDRQVQELDTEARREEAEFNRTTHHDWQGDFLEFQWGLNEELSRRSAGMAQAQGKNFRRRQRNRRVKEWLVAHPEPEFQWSTELQARFEGLPAYPEMLHPGPKPTLPHLGIEMPHTLCWYSLIPAFIVDPKLVWGLQELIPMSVQELQSLVTLCLEQERFELVREYDLLAPILERGQKYEFFQGERVLSVEWTCWSRWLTLVCRQGNLEAYHHLKAGYTPEELVGYSTAGNWFIGAVRSGNQELVATMHHDLQMATPRTPSEHEDHRSLSTSISPALAHQFALPLALRHGHPELATWLESHDYPLSLGVRGAYSEYGSGYNYLLEGFMDTHSLYTERRRESTPPSLSGMNWLLERGHRPTQQDLDRLVQHLPSLENQAEMVAWMLELEEDWRLVPETRSRYSSFDQSVISRAHRYPQWWSALRRRLGHEGLVVAFEQERDSCSVWRRDWEKALEAYQTWHREHPVEAPASVSSV